MEGRFVNLLNTSKKMRINWWLAGLRIRQTPCLVYVGFFNPPTIKFGLKGKEGIIGGGEQHHRLATHHCVVCGGPIGPPNTTSCYHNIYKMEVVVVGDADPLRTTVWCGVGRWPHPTQLGMNIARKIRIVCFGVIDPSHMTMWCVWQAYDPTKHTTLNGKQKHREKRMHL